MTTYTFAALKDEFVGLLATVQVRPECLAAVDKTARRLLKNVPAYKVISAKTGVPVVVLAALHEREASGRMDAYLGNGQPWNKRTTIEPANQGPFKSFEEGAYNALAIDGLDRVPRSSWCLALACFYEELFNGEGYRQFKHMRSPYLWGATNHQQPGKYVADRQFDPTVMDTQIGTVAIMVRMIQLDPSLAFGPVPVPAVPIAPLPPKPEPTHPAPPLVVATGVAAAAVHGGVSPLLVIMLMAAAVLATVEFQRFHKPKVA